MARVTAALPLALPMLVCPLCGTGLALQAPGSSEAGTRPSLGPVCCGRGHSFDVARQGYVNLLTGAGAKGLAADTAAMVQAREQVQAAGVFAAVADRLRDVAAQLPQPPGLGVLDLGCGTGYYTAAVLDALPGRAGIGLDLSTPAAKRAARAHPRLAAVVADAWARLPVHDAVIGLAMCVFAPRHPQELLRVLAPGGHLVVVTPRPAHLRALVEQIGLLSVDPDKQDRLVRQLADFTELSRDTVDQVVIADRELALAVVEMGPSAWHHSREDLATRIGRGPATRELHICVEVSVYTR